MQSIGVLWALSARGFWPSLCRHNGGHNVISKKLTWSLVSAASALVMVSMSSGCSSDETQAAAAGDSGTGGKSGGTGGRRATGGSTTGTGAASGAGGGGGAATCTAALGTVCDGAEDCPAGQHCCGRYQQRYTEIGCFPSCQALQGDGGPMMGAPLWFELCHAGDTCEDTTATCLTSSFLPGSLSRCLPSQLMGMASGSPPDATLGKNKNEVNCGSKTCGASEQCCIRMPLEPYCALKSATCACTEPDAGSGGDGGNQTDGSADGAAPDGGNQTDGSTPTSDGAPTRDAATQG
jgi:hypothetical protein